MGLDYVFTARNVTRAGFGIAPGPTKFLAVPDTANDLAPDQAITQRRWFDAVAAEAETGRDPNGRPVGDALIYLHGYNHPTSVMLLRLRAIRRGLEAAGFKGSVVGYDWPCGDMALGYVEDRKNAKLTALRLVDDGILPLVRRMETGCRISVHLLAHSMGALVAREALDDADDRDQTGARNWALGQVMLCSADISAGSMREGDKAKALYLRCMRLTNYSNPHDAVLSLSNVKRLGVAPRVGRVGLPEGAPSKAVNVDCGPYYDAHREDFQNVVNSDHCWYFFDPRFLEDVRLTIDGKTDRNAISTRVLQDGKLYLRP